MLKEINPYFKYLFRVIGLLETDLLGLMTKGLF